MVRPASSLRRAGALALLPCLLAAGSCATNPATGKPQLSFYGRDAEIEIGRGADAEIVQQVGLYDDPALAAYVEELGKRLAATSERADLPWSFKVLDDPAVNAFALPGGFVYVTRGILTHLSSEAELGGVIGHEIGHVTARHGVNQLSKQMVAAIALGAAVALAPRLEGWATAGSLGLGLLFLKYGRDDERQADDLGLRYMGRAGLDQRQLPEVFSVLQRVEQVGGAGRLPSWLASHPDPGARRQRIEEQLATQAGSSDGTVVGRDSYLARLDGVVFGANPRQGYFRGRDFLHPDLAFRFRFPEGWQTSNQTSSVSGASRAGDAAIEISLAAEATPREAADRFFGQQEGVERGDSRERSPQGLRGLWTGFEVPGDAAAQSGGGAEDALTGTVVFVSYHGNLFQLLGVAKAKGGTRRDVLEEALASFVPLTDPQALAVQPRHLKLVKIPQPMTLARFQELHPSTVPLETLALINHVQPGDTLETGRLVKQVVGEAAP